MNETQTIDYLLGLVQLFWDYPLSNSLTLDWPPLQL